MQKLQQWLAGMQADQDQKAAALEALAASDAEEQQHIAGMRAELEAAKVEAAKADEVLQRERDSLLQVQAASQAAQAQLEQATLESSTALSSAVDRAVAELVSRSADGRMRGAFFGRLQNVAYVTEPAATEAVNAVLRETSNPATTFVVSDRDAAADVLQHFHSGRIGLATCLIASEAPRQRDSAAGAHGAHLTPLMRSVAVQPSPGDSLHAAVQSRLGSWCLTQDRRTALAAVERMRAEALAACSIVTLAGELFKADGELVARQRAQHDHRSRAYLLSGSIKPLGASAVAYRVEGSVEQAAAVAELKRSLQGLAQQEAALVASTADQEMRLKVLHSAAAVKQREPASRGRQIGSAAQMQELRAGVKKAAREITKVEGQLKSARSQAEALQARARMLQEKSREAAAEWEAACAGMQGGHELMVAQKKFTDLSSQLQQAQQRREQAQQVVRKLERRLAALASARAAAADARALAAAEKLAERAQELDRRAEELKAQCKRSRAALKKAAEEAGKQEAHLRAATR